MRVEFEGRKVKIKQSLEQRRLVFVVQNKYIEQHTVGMVQIQVLNLVWLPCWSLGAVFSRLPLLNLVKTNICLTHLRS